MPIYVYRCSQCRKEVEKLQRVSDPPVTVCPECGTETMHKIIANVGIQFKGSGFYVTDNPHGSSAGSDSRHALKTPEKKESVSSEASSEGKQSKVNETKAESGK